jgi:hypothetical protein
MTQELEIPSLFFFLYLKQGEEKKEKKLRNWEEHSYKPNESLLYKGILQSGFVIFCHLIDIQFNLQHRCILSHAGMTGQRT